jgi:predicted nucleic acid-binding protein
MIILLDSTVLIDTLRSRSNNEILKGLVAEGHVLATSAVNMTEVYAGMRPYESARTESLFQDLECYPVTPAIGQRAGQLINVWARKGRTLELADMIVAATVLEHGLTLMTSNRKDFPMPEMIFYPLV